MFVFSENSTCFVFLKHPFWDSPFCLITDEFDFLVSLVLLQNVLPRAIIRVIIHVTTLLWRFRLGPFLLFTIFNALPEVLLNVFQYIFSKIILIYSLKKKKILVTRWKSYKYVLISRKVYSKAYSNRCGSELTIAVRWKRYKNSNKSMVT